MAEIGYSIAAKLIEVLAHEAILKICELWGYKSQLQELKKTVESVRMVLLDADSKWDQLNNQDRQFIGDLKDVLYDADDVFDEFRTLAELNQLGKLKKGGKYFDKVRRFFSSHQNQVGHANRMSRQVKDIKKRLDAISANHKKFELNVDNKPIVRRDRDTCSYVDANDIIGREEDKENIINMLLNENVSFLSIVGVGGLGKTALAQLIFNDEKIKNEFSDRRWVCVSDQEGQQFDVKSILCRITGQKLDSTSDLESVQSSFQEELKGKKYFLVLDDVWNEDREEWLRLKIFLKMGKDGSKVVVTTRSENTANIIGDGGNDHAYMLQGLSKKDSWHLFELSALTLDPKKDDHDQLVEIGHKIVEKCYCIPLAIKVVGSLLFGQEISKWRSLEGSGLANIDEGDNGIFPILKLSYYNLKPSIKSCFTYCAVFPKDYRIQKEKIIGLWMAQGYVIPLDGGQNLEDAAEEYFSILLRRCFFQDVERDKYDNIKSFKIHDLMHDVAQEVGKEEICIVTSTTQRLGDKIRHVCWEDGCSENSVDIKKIRSYFDRHRRIVDTQINNWMRLRVLDLSHSDVESVPDSIRNLLHLRYVDLTYSNLEVLCESITKLYNLQTLYLSDCRSLEELPKGMSKLVNLRHLNLKGCRKLRELPKGISDLVNLRHLNLEGCKKLRELPKGISDLVNLRHLNLKGCRELICMASGMNKLTNLRVLPLFVVGFKSNTESDDGVLQDLKALSNIQGTLCIKIGDKYRNVEDMSVNGGGYLKSMKCLRKLKIEFVKVSGESDWAEHEDILDKLHPSYSLKKFVLNGYKGKRLGRVWDNWARFLPLLVHIHISRCEKLEHLPVLSKLPQLETLRLVGLKSLEYMENGMSSSDAEATTQFFPSLRFLCISRCDHLKRLSGLEHLSSLEELILSDNSELSICEEDDDEPWKSFHQNLLKLNLENLPKLKSLPKGMQYLTSLQTLSLCSCENMEGELPQWMSSLSSLQLLNIRDCKSIKSLPEAIKELSSLKELRIYGCPDLKERCKKPDGEDFYKIQHIPNIIIDYTHIQNNDEDYCILPIRITLSEATIAFF